ncbi:hypothetical protein RDABS01_026126 [Bienertia sinuspersici]
MDHCVLEQVAAINCSSFSNSVLPSNLESRFQRLKTFPSSSSHPIQPQIANKSDIEVKPRKKELQTSIQLSKTEKTPISDDSLKTLKKESNSKGNSHSGFSSSSSGYLNSPTFRVKQGDKKGKDGNFSSGSHSFRSNSSDTSTKTVKTGCFWCSPKRVSRKKSVTRNGEFEMGDDWGKHDQILTDLKSFSSKNQKKLMKIAKKEEEKINKEAEKIVKWAKQTSARLDFSDIHDVDISDDDDDHNFGLH